MGLFFGEVDSYRYLSFCWFSFCFGKSKPDYFRSCNSLLPYFCNPRHLLVFTRFSPGFPPSLKKILLPAILGILLFQLLPFVHSRLNLFNPTILRNETLAITVILLLNGIVLSYFTKEQGFMIGVKKVFMIYGLQIFIFLRRLFRILFALIPDFSKIHFEKDLLILNSEFAFYFLEGLLS